MPNTINRYQLAKARKIAAYLQASADATMEATSAPMLPGGKSFACAK